MSRQLSAFSTALAVALFSSACGRDLPIEPIAPPQTSHIVSPEQDSRGHPRSRFDVDIKVSGSFRVGQPLQVQVATKGELSTADVELRLVLPELQYAQATNWRFDRTSVGLVDGKRSSKRVSIGAGSRNFRDTLVSFDQPGYYRVVASAFKRSAESDVVDGVPVLNVMHREVWFVVDSAGGRVTGEFDPAEVPSQYVAARGAFRLRDPQGIRNRPPRDRSEGANAPSSIQMDPPPGADRRIVYFHYDSSKNMGVPMVTVNWLNYDYQYGGPVSGGSFMTDENGYFQSTCPSYYEYSQGSYQLMNGKVNMGWGGQVTDQYFESGGGDCVWYSEIMFPSDQAHVYTRVTQIAETSATRFGFGRSQVEVEIRPVAVSRYESYWNKLILRRPDRDAQGRPIGNDAIWGIWGEFTMGHEYGHAVHDKALGGLPVDRTCPDPHGFQASDLNYGCAWSEGFANYHSMETVGTQMGGWFTAFVNGSWDRGVGTDGAMWEGPVATTLWAFTHHSSLAGAFSPNYIARMMRGECTLLTQDYGWKNPQGIDHLIYCLERQSPVSQQFQTTWFGARNTSSSIVWSIAEPAGGPFVSRLRSLWGTHLRGTTNIP